MRIGFDAHMIGQRETGNETYARGLLGGFERIGFAVDAYALDDITTGIHRVHRIWPASSAIRIPLSYPIMAIRDRLGIFHATYVLPPVLPCASVVTVHDITYALHPEWFAGSLVRRLSALVPFSIGRAARVITISEHSKRDIVERYRVPPEKVCVTYLAPRPEFLLPAVANRSDEPFFLYAGNVQPRKNIGTVVRALDIMRGRGVPARLVVAGTPGLYFEEVSRLIRERGLGGLVEFRGYVSDEELRVLYAGCTALVHPALYEGFGLTLVEAMAACAPVLAADTSSVPEVVGDAGLLLPATDPEAWADAMTRVLEDEELRAELRVRGQARALRFSWERCARETVDVYRAVLG